MDVVKMVEGELMVYGWGWSRDWDAFEEWNLENVEFLKVNIHTGEVEVLFEAENEMQGVLLHQFINETQLLT